VSSKTHYSSRISCFCADACADKRGCMHNACVQGEEDPRGAAGKAGQQKWAREPFTIPFSGLPAGAAAAAAAVAGGW